jgi:molybdenum cofactor synthesis domain-containing protein
MELAVDIEIACIGNELLIGKVVNTNASWLGKRATSFGIIVRRITVGPDDILGMAKIFCEILARKPRFLIITGGLGPTFDDKTLEGIANALNRKTAVNEAALRMVKEKYEEYSKAKRVPDPEMTPVRIKMATLPEGSIPLANPVGTAPGVLIDLEHTTVISLPGVPREMEVIFEQSVVPLLKQEAGEAGFFELSIYADSIMESVLAPLIDAVMRDNPTVYIKSHPKGRENWPHMELHLSTSGTPSENLQEQLSEAAVQLCGLIEASGGKVVKADTDTAF